MGLRSHLRFGVIFAIAVITCGTALVGAPRATRATDPPPNDADFSVDADTGAAGIQTTRTAIVGGGFNIEVTTNTTDMLPWEAYQVAVDYADVVLDAVGGSASWTATPMEGVRGGNAFPFTTGAFCTPATQQGSIYDDDVGSGDVYTTCTETTFSTSHTGEGPLMQFAFRCETAGTSTIAPRAIADTFLLDSAFLSYNDHQHDATITCCDDSLPDSDSDGLTDCEEADLGTNPNAVDTDGDGCADSEELGTVNYAGGLRDPLNPWDFYDVDGDKRVNAIDINKVRSKAFQDFPPYDRGMGAAPWAPGPPDGIVNAVDVGHVRASVNHYCVDPP